MPVKLHPKSVFVEKLLNANLFAEKISFKTVRVTKQICLFSTVFTV